MLENAEKQATWQVINLNQKEKTQLNVYKLSKETKVI